MSKNKQVIISHCKQETFTNPSAPSNISPGPFDSRRCLKFRVGDIYLRSCVSRDICQRGLDIIKSNCFCYFIQNKRFYIERKLTVCKSFHIFMFVDQLLLDIHNAVASVNADLQQICKWCAKNSLLLNPDKTGEITCYWLDYRNLLTTVAADIYYRYHA